jgi:hypothetical protein
MPLDRTKAGVWEGVVNSNRSESRHALHRRLAVAVIGGLTLSLLPAVLSQGAAAASASVSGRDVGSQQPSIAWESPAQRDADLDTIAAAGMTWVRADFYWGSIETERGHFSWSATDAFVRAARARGLRVLAMPEYTPAWARSGPTDKYPPVHPEDYAAFVRALAKRYAPMGVHAWEIWNEPNLSIFWKPRADPVAYTRLLKLAYTAIKHADPSATVVSGGLAPAGNTGRDVAPLTFVASMYEHGAKGTFDALGYHPYSYPYAPMHKAAWNTFYRTPDVHALMARYHDGGKAIWGTETGFPTGSNSRAVSAATQAEYMTAEIKQWTSWSFHGPIIFFSIRDSTTDRQSLNGNMGMLYYSRAPKPVFAAIKQLLRR